MIIAKDMEAIDGLPVLYVASLKALVISDLHLGYEGGQAKNGVMIPKANLQSVIAIISKALDGRDVEKVIVVGDIKNDFSGVINEELRELREIVDVLKKKGVALEMVKGNHDNFIESYSNALGIRVYHEQLVLDDYLFAHGDKELGESDAPFSTVIMGHEHPSIGIRSKVGTIERLRCFLKGTISYRRRKVSLIVLPAIGYFETGSDINLHRKGRLMSPILKKAGVEDMEVIAVGFGSTLPFGKMKDLRDIEI
jgi:putative SbcD/Mre11-related phosphoesterase